MKTPRNYDPGSVANHDFAPFEDWDEAAHRYFGLVMDGEVILDQKALTENDDCSHEWHLGYYGGDIWEIEYSKAPELCTVVYRGKLPTREAFLTIMANVEESPAWARAPLVPRSGNGLRWHKITSLSIGGVEHEIMGATCIDGIGVIARWVRDGPDWCSEALDTEGGQWNPVDAEDEANEIPLEPPTVWDDQNGAVALLHAQWQAKYQQTHDLWNEDNCRNNGRIEALETQLAAAHKALMVCDGAMMGKVNPKSVAFKRINEILRPETPR